MRGKQQPNTRLGKVKPGQIHPWGGGHLTTDTTVNPHASPSPNDPNGRPLYKKHRSPEVRRYKGPQLPIV